MGGPMTAHPHAHDARAALGAPWYGLTYLVATTSSEEDAPHPRAGPHQPLQSAVPALHGGDAWPQGQFSPPLYFGEVTAAVDALYREGGRCLYLEGGEPFLWHDGPRRLDDIVEYARALGYLTVVVYTNGTLPLRTSADTVFVSVDGLGPTHDALRGASFQLRTMRNIRESAHGSLFVNYTVNARNKDDVRAFCDYVEGVHNVRGVFFYLHTPYYGHDALAARLRRAAARLERTPLSPRAVPGLHSTAGLRAALRNDWARPLTTCSVYEKGIVHKCCRYSGDPGLCRQRRRLELR